MEIHDDNEIDQTKFRDNIPLQSLVKLYTVWPGKNRFYLGGKIMTGPANDQGPNLLAWMLILGLPLIYFYIVGEHMMRFEPYFLCLSIALYFLMTISFALTQFTEPGIIPRKDVQVMSQCTHPYFLEEDNRPRKFCETCKVFKRQQTSHCSEEFVTIAYEYLIIIVLLQTIALGRGTIMLLMGGTSIIEMISYVDETNKNASIPPAFMIIFVAVISIIGTIIFLFFCFHLYLMFSGKTTKQQFKQITLESQDTDENDWFTQSDSLFEPTQLVHI